MRVEQHEIADRVLAVANVDGAQDHHDHERHGEDDALPRVEHGERDVARRRIALVALHRLVVALGLALLGAEILDRLVVEQRVDRLRVGVGVALVHVAADGDAPVRRHAREPEIRPDHDDHGERVAPVEREEEDAEDQRELHHRRNAGEHAHAHDLLDGLAAALEDARQPAGLALEMEAQRQAGADARTLRSPCAAPRTWRPTRTARRAPA